MNILQKLVLLTAVITGSFVAVGAQAPAYALFEGASDAACQGANLNGSTKCEEGKAAGKIGSTVTAILNILSIIVGIAAVILIIINGLRFITSGGDSNSVSAAKNGVIYAIVGLIVVALAQVIVRFVLGRI